jgi:hypothetical protein
MSWDMLAKPQNQRIGSRVGRCAEEDAGLWLDAKDLENRFNNGSIGT